MRVTALTLTLIVACLVATEAFVAFKKGLPKPPSGEPSKHRDDGKEAGDQNDGPHYGENDSYKTIRNKYKADNFGKKDKLENTNKKRSVKEKGDKPNGFKGALGSRVGNIVSDNGAFRSRLQKGGSSAQSEGAEGKQKSGYRAKRKASDVECDGENDVNKLAKQLREIGEDYFISDKQQYENKFEKEEKPDDFSRILPFENTKFAGCGKVAKESQANSGEQGGEEEGKGNGNENTHQKQNDPKLTATLNDTSP